MADLERQIQYCNREWFTISGHPNAPSYEIDWTTLLNKENLAIMNDHFDQIVRTKQPVQFQIDCCGPGRTTKASSCQRT